MSDELENTQAWSPDSARLWKNRYAIEKELARGGFGIVYLARDRQLLSKPVVVKALLETANPDPYIQKKFRQEIEALARIDHPGIVGVLDVGDAPDGKPFLVMQFVEGVTLRSAIGKGGVPLQQAGRIIRQACQALTAAHEKGVLHRDLKPENIMLQTLGDGEVQVKLIDFGIAAVRDSQIDQTQLTSKVAGTLAYMAPEQVMGKATAASDIYALGVIAFEMVTGERPENSPEGVTRKPREFRPELSDAAQQVILKALSYRPEDRQTRPREFGDRLAEALGDGPATATAPAGGSTAVQSSAAGLEMAYVLFMDLVNYSRLPMEQQTQRIQQLQTLVRGTAEFQQASGSNNLISLPTGDGMALVFFQNPVSPAQCATEISRSLREKPELLLRMGIHTGPVYRIDDINANRNVTGGGINLAQRVMDCGDAGHILLSKTFADVLIQLGDWADSLHDLGEVEVKHGAKLHLVNLHSASYGNEAAPTKLIRRDPAPTAVDSQTASSASRSRTGAAVGAAIAAVLVLGAASYYFGLWSGSTAEPPVTETPAATTPAPPAEVNPTAAETTSPPPQADPAPAEDAATTAPEPPAQPSPSPPAPEAPPNTAGTAAASADPAAGQARGLRGRGAAQELRQYMLSLTNRAAELGRLMQETRLPPNQRGAAIRQQFSTARESFQKSLADANASLTSGDLPSTRRHLQAADRQVTIAENALRAIRGR